MGDYSSHGGRSSKGGQPRGEGQRRFNNDRSSGQGQRGDRRRGENSDRPRRDDRGERKEWGDRPHRSDRYERSDRPRNNDRRDDRGDRRSGDRPYHSDDRRENRPDRGEGRNWNDRSRNNDRDDRRGGDRTYRDDRPRRDDRRDSRGERKEWGDRPRSNDRRDDNRRGDRPQSADRRHSQRGGSGRNEGKFHSGPNRASFREERDKIRSNEPDLPSDIDAKDLDPSVIQDLRSLAKDNADAVAKHMIMAATLMADDPQLALRHARAAKDRGGRVSVVRETAGIAAYHAGEWKEALSELRAARRMSGGPGLIAVMADCERALGRPEKAIELAREVDAAELDEETQIELAIVISGARRDLGQTDAAVTELSKLNPQPEATGISAARLMYAYADTLLAAGRKDEAKQWFEHCKKADEDGFLDIEDRLKELS